MPGIRCNFQVDATNFSRALARYASEVQNDKSRAQVVREQMAYAIRGIIDLTPFETLAQGREAVHKHLLAAIKPYGGENGSFDKIQNDGLRARLQSYLRTGQYDKIKDVFSQIGKKGYYANFQMVDFAPRWHHSVQDRKGHVNREHNILTPQVKEWKAYLQKLQGQVGRARGGWVASAEAVGLRGLPGWVTRWKEGGSASVQVDPGRVTFTFINRSVFVPNYRDAVEVALEGRVKAMAGDLRRMYDNARTHAGFGR